MSRPLSTLIHISHLLSNSFLVKTHLPKQLHGIKMVGDLHEPGLFDGLLAISVNKCAALHAALLSNLTTTWHPLLGHLSELSLALIDDVHSDLHPQFFLFFCQLYFFWGIDCYVFYQVALGSELVGTHYASGSYSRARRT